MPGPFTYVYLVGALLFVPVWLLMYWRLPSARREMLMMSALFVCIGVPSEALLYTRDWWHPETVTGTLIGIEDVIYSIGNGGYMAALYIALTRRGALQATVPPRWPLRLAPVAAIAVLPSLCVFVLGMHSFVATSVGSLVALTIILAVRPDLTRVAVVTGVVGTIIAIPVYLAIEAAFPGAIAATWNLTHLSGLLPLGIPIEDLAWYLYTAALWGTYYKFATGQRVVSQASMRSSSRSSSLSTRRSTSSLI